MTVADLIERLKAFPADMPVVTDGYEGGYDDVAIPEQIDVDWNRNTTAWFFGRHSEVSDYDHAPKDRRAVVKI